MRAHVQVYYCGFAQIPVAQAISFLVFVNKIKQGFIDERHLLPVAVLYMYTKRAFP